MEVASPGDEGMLHAKVKERPHNLEGKRIISAHALVKAWPLERKVGLWKQERGA
jgi:hypothetical protein